MKTKPRGLTRSITRKQALSYARLTPNGLGVTAIASVNGRRTSKAFQKKYPAFYKGIAAASRKKKPRFHEPVTERQVRGPPRAFEFNAKRGRAPKKKRIQRWGWDHGVFLSGRAARRATGRASLAKKPSRRGTKPKWPWAKNPSADYRRRYAKTRKILAKKNSGKAPSTGWVFYKPPKPRASKKRIHGIPMMSVGGDFPAIVPPAPRRRGRSSSPKETSAMKRKSPRKAKKAKRTPAQRAATKRMLAALKASRKKSAGGAKRKKRKATRSPAQKAATKKMLAAARRSRRHVRNPRRRRSYARNAKKKTSRGRTYAGFKSVTARVGTKTFPTYLYRSGKGLKHIPLYAVAGQKSKASVRSLLGKGGKAADAYRRRMAAISGARGRASDRVKFHGDIFTPNKKRGIVVPYETWSASMTPNKKRRAKKKGRKASHPKRSAARRPVARLSKRARAARKGAATKRRNHAIRVKAAKKAARTRARGKGRGKAMKRNFAATPNRRRRHHHRRNKRRSYLPIRVERFRSNRRRRHARRHHHYRANFNAKDFMKRLQAVLKVGAIVAVGFGVHRAATKIFGDQVLAKVGFATGPLATYRGLISGLIVGSIGLVATDKLMKGKAVEFNSGMFASLAHSVLTTLLNAAGQGNIAAALSAYPDAEGKAYHGFGEYVPVNGLGRGFGAYEMVNGLGAPPLLSQAAAGFGDLATRARYGASPTLAQAAAGMGAPPMLSQAAAGTGEYLAQGVQGIGDYEMVHGVGSPAFGMDEGIRPDLRSAEHALNIAEAAAGFALGDLPSASTLNPSMLAQPVEDAPAGMRAGILQGGDGIFG